jgi:pilus assembly protein Flp/PilA
VRQTNKSRSYAITVVLKCKVAHETGAIEYGLIAAGISLAIIAVVNGFGARLNPKFTSIDSPPR